MKVYRVKVSKENKTLIDVFLQSFQALMSLCVISLAVYGLFFSNFSQFVEGELRSNLANSQYENLQLKKQKDELNEELESVRISLKHELKAVAEIVGKKKALEQEQWQRVVKVFLEGVQSRISRYRSFNKKPGRIISDIEWARIHAEKLAGTVAEDLVKGTSKEGKLSAELMAALLSYRLNNSMRNIARATARDGDKKPQELEIRSYLERDLRRRLYVPLTNPVTGEPIYMPPRTGASTIERLLRDSNIRYLSQEAAKRFRDVVLSFLENNRDQMNRPLEFRMSSIDDSFKEILVQSAYASQNVTDFELSMAQLKEVLLEGQWN